jgi:DNA-3-methyladenine glycosylase
MQLTLRHEFYNRHTVDVARDLLGKILIVREMKGSKYLTTKSRIVETEAYRAGDEAAHSHRGRTPRTNVMFGPPGFTYVYTMHRQNLLNLVTEPENEPGAVLIRAVEPINGLESMQRRRPNKKRADLTNGPGKLCQALGITLADNQLSLNGPRFKVVDDGYRDFSLSISVRIGISKSTELAWRFFVKDNAFVSGKRP